MDQQPISRLPSNADELVDLLKTRLKPTMEELMPIAQAANDSFRLVPGVPRGFLDGDAAEDAIAGVLNGLQEVVEQIERVARANGSRRR